MKQSDIVYFRTRHRLTQKELAKALGSSEKSVQNWEAGTSRLNGPKLERIKKYFDSLDFVQSGNYSESTSDLIDVLFLLKSGRDVSIVKYADPLIEKLRLYEVVKKENEELRKQALYKALNRDS